ncbi:hypothetical protein U9M48_024170 [Paspalum notatum var. saurae]|uniref:Uncharacterized protein n=1 Tax=Paspalum notatum var. saurae TaxID=547442 RepID=A0AAQ3TMQ9_PASNO
MLHQFPQGFVLLLHSWSPFHECRRHGHNGELGIAVDGHPPAPHAPPLQPLRLRHFTALRQLHATKSTRTAASSPRVHLRFTAAAPPLLSLTGDEIRGKWKPAAGNTSPDRLGSKCAAPHAGASPTLPPMLRPISLSRDM